jgi:hypothetical protein
VSPRTRLELACEIVRDVILSPTRIYFNETQGSPSATPRKFAIFTRTNATFRITGVTTNGKPFFTAQMAVTEEGRRYEWTVRPKIDGLQTIGASTCSLSIRTDHPDHPLFTVPVTLYIRKSVVFAPRQLLLTRQGSRYRNLPQYLLVHAPDGKPFEILEVEVPDDAFDTEVTQLAPGRHRLSVKNADSVEGLDGKMLRIKVKKAGREDVLEVPIRVR